MDADVCVSVFSLLSFAAWLLFVSLSPFCEGAGHTAKLFDRGVARQRRRISSSET